MNISYSKIGKRFLALTVDEIIISLIVSCVTGVMLAGNMNNIGDISSLNSFEPLMQTALVISLARVFISFGYGALLELTKGHATLGKKLLKLKVANAEGREPRTLDILVRNVMKNLPLLFMAIFNSGFMAGFAGFMQVAYYIVPLCNKKHLAIHDYVSATAVIMGEYVSINKTDVQDKAEVDLEQQSEESVDMGYTRAPQFVHKEHVLLGIAGQYVNARFPLSEAIIMGRNQQQCNIIFSEDTKGVSRVHCEVGIENGMVYIKDLNASYGTTVNGTIKLENGEKKILHTGNIFTIGKNETFRIE